MASLPPPSIDTLRWGWSAQACCRELCFLLVYGRVDVRAEKYPFAPCIDAYNILYAFHFPMPRCLLVSAVASAEVACIFITGADTVYRFGYGDDYLRDIYGVHYAVAALDYAVLPNCEFITCRRGVALRSRGRSGRAKRYPKSPCAMLTKRMREVAEEERLERHFFGNLFGSRRNDGYDMPVGLWGYVQVCQSPLHGA